jgi:hypothetical protein
VLKSESETAAATIKEADVEIENAALEVLIKWYCRESGPTNRLACILTCSTGTTTGTRSVRNDAAAPSRAPPPLPIRHLRPSPSAICPLYHHSLPSPLAFLGPDPLSPSHNLSGTLAESASTDLAQDAAVAL